MQYLSAALAKRPYMGVGRNLCYKKQLFDKNDGFKSHEHLSSGDDDLFINQIANQYNTTIAIHPATFCYSVPPRNWRAWYQQKNRHLSTGTHYQLKHQVLLGFLSFSHFGFYGTLIVSIFLFSANSWILYLLWLGYSSRCLSQLYVFNGIFKQLQVTMPLWYVPVLDFLMVFYYLIFAPSVFLNKKVTWNKPAQLK